MRRRLVVAEVAPGERRGPLPGAARPRRHQVRRNVQRVRLPPGVSGPERHVRHEPRRARQRQRRLLLQRRRLQEEENRLLCRRKGERFKLLLLDVHCFVQFQACL
jgi:hypothetical protein